LISYGFILGTLNKVIFLSINTTYQELHATFLSLARQVKELEGLANQHKELIQENQRLIKREWSSDKAKSDASKRE
jgi:hypothetical protein